MRVGWIQGRYAGSPEEAWAYYIGEAESITADNTIELLALPELFHAPYFPIVEEQEGFNYSITEQSDIINAFMSLCKERSVVCVLPYFERRGAGIYHNSAIVIERDGTIAGRYRKMHIPDDPGYYEKYYFHPGDSGFRVIATSVGKLGVLICWDQWFPEAARILAMQGAELLVYPTAIGWDMNEDRKLHDRQLDAWITMMRSHSIANGLFSIAVNRAGDEGFLRFWGSSILVHPDGRVLNEPSMEDESGFCDIDFADIETQRRGWPFFRDRRIDAYGSILKLWNEEV